MRAGVILWIMGPTPSAPFDPEASDDLALTTRWIPLVIPLSAVMILAMMMLIWIEVLA